MSMVWDYGYATLRERAIERVKGVHHTTVIHWVKQVGKNLPDVYNP
jgi:transposase-like protein